MALTDLQNKMLKKIARSEMTQINGAEPSTADQTLTWADCALESHADGGVFTSLQKIGFVWIQNEPDKRDSVVGLTETGFTAYKSSSTVTS
jgi:hypothetical protein